MCFHYQAHIRKWHESGEDDDSTSVCGTAAEKKRVLNGHLRTVSILSNEVAGIPVDPPMHFSGSVGDRGEGNELEIKQKQLKHNTIVVGNDSSMDDNELTVGIPANKNIVDPSRTEIVYHNDGGLTGDYTSPPSHCTAGGDAGVPAIRPFRCDQCLKLFKTKSTLANHALQHSAQSPFTCAVESCSASFKSDKELNVHRERVHGLAPKRYPCTAREDCTMQFAKYGHYKRHMLTHSGKFTAQ